MRGEGEGRWGGGVVSKGGRGGRGDGEEGLPAETPCCIRGTTRTATEGEKGVQGRSLGRGVGGGGVVISFPLVFFPESPQGAHGRSAAALAREGKSAPRNRSRDRHLHLP